MTIEIIYQPKDMERVIDEACQSLGLCDDVFIHGGAICILTPSKLPSAMGVVEYEEASFKPLNNHGLRAKLTEAAIWKKHQGKGDDAKLVVMAPTLEIASAILARPDMWGPIKEVAYFSISPLVTPAGEVIAETGYCEDIKTYSDLNSRKIERPSGRLYRKHALAALEKLMAPISEYRWMSPADKSVALAAILTPFVRPFIRTAPLIIFDAPVRGSGKTKLAEVCVAISTGLGVRSINQAHNEEEERKRMLAMLRSGNSIIVTDNVSRPIGSDLLDTITTTGVFQDRVLGASEMIKVKTKVTLIYTGNNVELAKDTVRRAIVCRINPDTECPERVQYPFDPVEVARERCDELAEAAITILSAFIKSKKRITCPPFNSFEDWSRIVRECLLWLDMADPYETTLRLSENDDQDDDIRDFVRLMHDLHGEQYITLDKMFMANGHAESGRRIAMQLQGVARAMCRFSGHVDIDSPNFRKTLGHVLKKHVDRVFSGYRFKAQQSRPKGPKAYQVQKITTH